LSILVKFSLEENIKMTNQQLDIGPVWYLGFSPFDPRTSFACIRTFGIPKHFCFCSLLCNYIAVSISEILNIMRVGFLLQALLKLVADCSVVALNPSRKDAVNESPLKIALFSLAKMCSHPPCRQFLSSSELFPVIGRLRQSPESTIAQYASVIINKI
jgi:hypothetical protein